MTQMMRSWMVSLREFAEISDDEPQEGDIQSAIYALQNDVIDTPLAQHMPDQDWHQQAVTQALDLVNFLKRNDMESAQRLWQRLPWEMRDYLAFGTSGGEYNGPVEQLLGVVGDNTDDALNTDDNVDGGEAIEPTDADVSDGVTDFDAPPVDPDVAEESAGPSMDFFIERLLGKK